MVTLLGSRAPSCLSCLVQRAGPDDPFQPYSLSICESKTALPCKYVIENHPGISCPETPHSVLYGSQDRDDEKGLMSRRWFFTSGQLLAVVKKQIFRLKRIMEAITSWFFSAICNRSVTVCSFCLPVISLPPG